MAESSIDRAAVEKAAKLARLEIEPTEIEQLTKQLQNVLANFEKVAQVQTDGVEPLVTPSDFEAQVRADEVKVELKAEDITANAPAKQGNLFAVPPVV
ncbi:MAG: Asp-tRNA(Asn)/Glu-tRNA(Gln) amidotransferase subunit GatC [Bdellovibrionaceae bacterium]|nr:Asp-tRNA(Asn)/Glu-tRNA(Gln) amidotransferase subunit GatC [Pseudobdellovibrionaceae bacterium]